MGVGNISHRAHPRDVEDLFRDYGELVDFDFKDRGQQVNFCFVEFKSSRDAEDAMDDYGKKEENEKENKQEIEMKDATKQNEQIEDENEDKMNGDIDKETKKEEIDENKKGNE